MIVFVFAMDKKRRNSNWTSKDKCTLVDIYKTRHNTIVGKFKCPAGQTNNQLRQKAWASILGEFNACNPDSPRSIEEVKMKIENLKVSDHLTLIRLIIF